MFVVQFFAKVPSIKYIRWDKPSRFDSVSPLYTLKKNDATKTIDYTFSQAFLFPLPVNGIRSLSMEPNLKMSPNSKERVKSQIWD